MPLKMGDKGILPDDHPLAKAITKTMGKPPTAEEVAKRNAELENEDDQVPTSDADDVMAGDPVDLETVIKEASQAAEMTYEDRLRAQGISLKEAHEVVDAILTNKVFTKTFPLASGVSVTFKTRTPGDNHESLLALEKATYGYSATIAEHHTTYNLAYSLHSIGSNDLSERTVFDPKRPEQTIKFLRSIPTQYFALLVDLLIKFENLIKAVLEDGVIQNF